MHVLLRRSTKVGLHVKMGVVAEAHSRLHSLNHSQLSRLSAYTDCGGMCTVIARSKPAVVTRCGNMFTHPLSPYMAGHTSQSVQVT